MMSKENVFNSGEKVIISSGNRYVAVKFLNDETVYFSVEKKCKANELFSKICVHLGLADCTELFGLAIKQINYPTSLLGSITNSAHYYSASQVENSIKQDDTQFEEDYIFLNPNSKLSKYTTKQWKNSKNGLNEMGKAYLQCFFRVQFYVDSYLFITDRIARHHYYLQLRENVINYNLSNLTLERAFLLTSLALQVEKGNYNELNLHIQSKSSSILNSTFINNDNNLNQLNKCYFDPFDYMPKWIVYQMGEAYICENMPTMHKEQYNISRADAEIMFIKEASEICPHNLHMYRLFKSNPSSLNKKLNNVNTHFNAFFHGHHFNSSINSNSSYSSTMTNQSSNLSNSNMSNFSSNLSMSNLNKESKVWLAISATGVQLFEQDKQIFINKSNNSSFLDLNSQENQLQDSTSTVCYLRTKLSTFVWADIEKLFFDKKKFEIRSNGYPTRKFTYYTHSDEMAKNLLWLCKMSHRFQLYYQPKLKEIKKRESELSRKKYRESYIYSDADKTNNDKDNKEIKLKIDNLVEYQAEPNLNRYMGADKPNIENSPLSTSRNTLVGKESLNLSQDKDYHLKPLSDEMKPIMDKFDKQISKLQFNQTKEQNLIDLASSNNQLVKSTNESSSGSTGLSLDQPMKLDKSIDQVDFINFVNEFKNYNNPFLDKSSQMDYQLFPQSSQLENLDKFVIEHKKNCGEINVFSSNNLTVQPSNQVEIKQIEQQLNEQKKQLEQNVTSLKIKLNDTNPFQLASNTKPNKQTFSLESLTCSGLSEPSSSGISEQEFSTTSDQNNERKSNSFCSPTNNEHSNLSHLNHLNNESPNSMQSRCSSNTSYSSDSALGKCDSSKPIQSSKLPVPSKKIATNYKKNVNVVQKLKQYANSAFSVDDLNRIENYISSINNNHLLENYNDDDEFQNNSNKFNIQQQSVTKSPKPRPRKSKFELKHKNKLNAMQYKSLPNVNDFETNRFGRLDIESDRKEKFNFLNRSDKSTSSEQSVSTIKSNDKTDSLIKLNNQQNPCHLNSSINNATSNNSDQQHWMKSIHIYENLPFQSSVNNLLNSNITPTTANNPFLPAPNLINTTPNRIATKIGVSSLNRCNKIGSNQNSAQKNPNLRINIFDTKNLVKQNLRTCSYQLLNNEINSTINTPLKTIRASSDPGVLTYCSTSNLMKMQSKDSCVFYHNSPSLNASLNQSTNQSSQLITNPRTQTAQNYRIGNQSSLTNSMFYRSLNNINGDINYDNSTNNNLAYDQPLINQINNQRKISIRNHPLRFAESEMNLIKQIPPPTNFSDHSNYKMKATSEQQLNAVEPKNYVDKLIQNNNQKTRFTNEQKDSIDSLKQKSYDLDHETSLPMITALMSDKSLMMLPKTTTCSREKHQKPQRYSSHFDNIVSDFGNLSTSSAKSSYKQTNLDDESTIFDQSNESFLQSSLRSDAFVKYDKNYNNLESNNLNNTLNRKSHNNRADYIDQIWADNSLN